MADHQLQEIKCGNKRVILHIISAYGFNLVKGSILIHATFMNKTLKTPPITINNNELICNSNHIWYMDNATLRKLKMSNATIKIECFHIPTNESNITAKLGYFILKIKEAQVIYKLCNERIDTRSYKLIGSKYSSYSFKASLRIEDFNFNDMATSSIKMKLRKSVNSENEISKDQHFVKEEEKNHVKENIKTDLSKNNFDTLVDRINKLTDTDINKFTRKLDELYKFENKEKNLCYKINRKEKQEITDKELESFNNTPTINELNQKIIDLETKASGLERNYVLLNIPKEQISHMTIDRDTRIRQLEKTVLELVNKYQEFKEISMYFKGKWIISERKLTRLYERLS